MTMKKFYKIFLLLVIISTFSCKKEKNNDNFDTLGDIEVVTTNGDTVMIHNIIIVHNPNDTVNPKLIYKKIKK